MKTRVTVLAYHAVGDCEREEDRHNLFVPEPAFAAQMAFLARRRRVISLNDAIGGRIASGSPAVAITFDDGYRNVLTNAGPLLRRYGFEATVFVPTAYLGGRNTWIEPSRCDLDIMNARELRVAEEMNLRIESHGHEHIDYSQATRNESEEDLKKSLTVIEEHVGRRPKHFAYPYGRRSEIAQDAALVAGLRAAYTIDEPHDGDFAYARVQITPLDGMRLFALKTSGRYTGLRHGRVMRAAYGAVKPVARKVLRRAR